MEYEMLDLNELSEHLQVQTNILNEKRRERELYERGVKAMAEASSKEQMWAIIVVSLALSVLVVATYLDLLRLLMMRPMRLVDTS